MSKFFIYFFLKDLVQKNILLNQNKYLKNKE